MATGGSASPDSQGVDWATYAKDARDFLLATSHAGPTAARVWTAAWCEWATSAATMHEQMALRWNAVIKDPARGPAMLDEMRKNFKDYLLVVGGIPERAVLSFTVAMEASVGTPKDVPSPKQAFLKEAQDTIGEIMEGLNLLERTRESQPAARSRTVQTAGPDDPGAALRDKISRLHAALARLRNASEQSAG